MDDNKRKLDAIRGMAVIIVAMIIGALLGWVVSERFQGGLTGTAMPDGDATYQRCVDDCVGGHEGNVQSLYKPSTPSRQAECWCRPKLDGFYEMVW